MSEERKLKPSDYIRKGWCQETFARDAKGNSVDPRSSEACCWCIAGAIKVAYPMTWPVVLERLTDSLQRIASLWNDAPERTQAEVIAALEAIGQ